MTAEPDTDFFRVAEFSSRWQIRHRPPSKENPPRSIESLHQTAMIGTPEQVIERLRYYEELGVDEFSFWCDNSPPHDEK